MICSQCAYCSSVPDIFDSEEEIYYCHLEEGLRECPPEFFCEDYDPDNFAINILQEKLDYLKTQIII
jgi:hypothetical protein